MLQGLPLTLSIICPRSGAATCWLKHVTEGPFSIQSRLVVSSRRSGSVGLLCSPCMSPCSCIKASRVKTGKMDASFVSACKRTIQGPCRRHASKNNHARGSQSMCFPRGGFCSLTDRNYIETRSLISLPCAFRFLGFSAACRRVFTARGIHVRLFPVT